MDQMKFDFRYPTNLFCLSKDDLLLNKNPNNVHVCSQTNLAYFTLYRTSQGLMTFNL